MKQPIALRQLVGKNVRSLRRARGWSQEELGEQAELSYKFIGEIERGAVNPSLDSLEKIASALTIEVFELFLHQGLMILTPGEVAKVETSIEVLQSVLGSARNRLFSEKGDAKIR
jgi:transcriptional regulator with XRE-family HTH domain